jgi:hypothetical protein
MTARSLSPSSLVRRLRSGDESGWGGEYSGLSGGSGSAALSAARGPLNDALQLSRTARVRARLTRIRKIDALRDMAHGRLSLARPSPRRADPTTQLTVVTRLVGV